MDLAAFIDEKRVILSKLTDENFRECTARNVVVCEATGNFKSVKLREGDLCVAEIELYVFNKRGKKRGKSRKRNCRERRKEKGRKDDKKT